MKSFVVGDVHGGHRALKQVLDRSGFDKTQDQIIALGDLCDGWPETPQVLEALLTIQHRIIILGNHDDWFLNWISHGCRMEWTEEIWVTQGGEATLKSYAYQPPPETHTQLLRSAKIWHKDAANRIFVHGGFNPVLPIERARRDDCLWDRELLHMAVKRHQRDPAHRLTSYPEIYVGHTPTSLYKSDVPMHVCEVWAMDTGGGWEGRLSLMNLETKEVFQSDPVADLYPDTEHARIGRAQARSLRRESFGSGP